MEREGKTMCWILGGFLLLGMLIYGQSLGSAFVRWDDGMLIYENPAIRTIRPWSLWRVFTSYDPELYIPLTFVSYQLNYLIGGIHPFGYKLLNLLLHIGNAALVMACIGHLTKKRTLGIITGLLFLVHPLQTEAVEWASARKDVLSTFFFLGALLQYMRWKQDDARPSRFAWSIAFFVLALLSKVMAITLPIVLLLTDWLQGRSLREKRTWIEKWPYFAIAIVFGIIGMAGKSAIVSSTALSVKLLMAAKSTVFYLQQIFWPRHFSLLYPYTKSIEIFSSDFLIPIGILLLLAFALVLSLRWTKILAFALIFYGITLAPTFLNFAKGGDLDVYFASDRYAYVPSIGIFLLISLVLLQTSALLKRHLGNLGTGMVTVVCAVLFLGLGTKAWAQSKVWENTETLFRNVIDLYPESSYVAHNNIGNAYRLDGDLKRAKEEYLLALKIRRHPKVLSNLGAVYRKEHRYDDAIRTYRDALVIGSESPDPHFGLGIVYADLKDFSGARREYEDAIRLDPSKAEYRVNLGVLLAEQGDFDGAILQYQKAISLAPDHPVALFNLGVAYSAKHRTLDAIRAYERSIMIAPSIAALLNLGSLYYEADRIADAKHAFETVLKYSPSNAAARSALAQLKSMR